MSTSSSIATSSTTISDSSVGSSTALSSIHDPGDYIGKSLSEDEKFHLLSYSWKFPTTYKFPVTSARKFSCTWLVNRPWLCYSVKNDGVLCTSCICFGSTDSPSPFMSKGFRN